MSGMWSRCWWATWVSGFFGIFGALHVLRLWLRVPLRLGGYEVPFNVTLLAGVVCLLISAGLLWVEAVRERSKLRR